MASVYEREFDEGEVGPRPAQDEKLTVKLTGENGNIFFLIAICRKALKKSGQSKEVIDAFTNRVSATRSYDAALALIMKEFDVC